MDDEVARAWVSSLVMALMPLSRVDDGFLVVVDGRRRKGMAKVVEEFWWLVEEVREGKHWMLAVVMGSKEV